VSSGCHNTIDANTNDILWSLLKITEFVKQRNLGRKIEKDISYIVEFGSEVIVDFIWKNHRELIITTNKVAADSDLNTIKNIDVVNSEDIMSLRLP